jgi:hypothetical protein
MAFSQAQLDALDDAIAAGVLTYEYQGKRIQYQSLSDMLAARNLIQRELGGTSGNAPASYSLGVFDGS